MRQAKATKHVFQIIAHAEQASLPGAGKRDVPPSPPPMRLKKKSLDDLTHDLEVAMPRYTEWLDSPTHPLQAMPMTPACPPLSSPRIGLLRPAGFLPDRPSLLLAASDAIRVSAS